MDDTLEQIQNRRRDQVVSVGQVRCPSIGSEQKLHEVVRADRDEINFFHESRKLPKESRHFKHGPYAELSRLAIGTGHLGVQK